jgi:hypothetical protein
METIRIKSTDEASQGSFVIIARGDFNPELHEAVDPGDLDQLLAEQPRVLTTVDLEEARAELSRRHEELLAMRADLDTRHEGLNAQAAEQEAERVRLAELAAKLAEQAEAKPLGIADLRAELTARGIAFDPDAKKPDLKALLDAADAQK